jgi:hypothetical protein
MGSGTYPHFDSKIRIHVVGRVFMAETSFVGSAVVDVFTNNAKSDPPGESIIIKTKPC